MSLQFGLAHYGKLKVSALFNIFFLYDLLNELTSGISFEDPKSIGCLIETVLNRLIYL